MANRTAEKTEACAAALRRHRFEAEVVKDAEAAFALMKAVVEAENPQLVSFGDSMTMRGTGIVEWLRSNGRLTLLDGFDASKPYEERLEIRRRALLSDLFITGVNAVTEQGTLHWLDKVGNRIAPVAFGPRKVIIVAGRNKIVADRDEAEEHPPDRRPAERRATPRIPHPLRQNGRLRGLQLAGPHLQHPDGNAAMLARQTGVGNTDRRRFRIMMKQLKYGTACLLLLAAACGDDSDAFYTAVYPVVRVEAEITLPDPEPGPTDPTDPTDPTNPTDPTEPETKAGENETDPVVERIREEIEAAAPVKAGGSYVLEFTKYNGGRLRIRQTAEADRVRGVFFKDPGATDILVYCPEPAMKYTCVVSAYKAEDGTSKTLLTVDLTEEYQALYPEAGITKAVRREYTSANAK